MTKAVQDMSHEEFEKEYARLNREGQHQAAYDLRRNWWFWHGTGR